jgi:carboxyl-terminal processing protease
MPTEATEKRNFPLGRWLVLWLLVSMNAPAATLHCLHIPQLFEFYLRRHYAYKTLTDTIKQHTVEQYVKSLDASKTLLLDADVTKLNTDLMQLFNTIKTGNCGALETASKLLLQRAQENEEYVKKFLGKDYKLDESVELTLDPKKRGYAKTKEEKQDTLRKLVHFQISNFLLTDLKLPEAKKQLIHRYELITKRLSERKEEDILAGYAEAFAEALDPHSSFLSKDNLEDFQIQMQLSLEGIGASLSSQDGFTVIEDLIPGGGAERSNALRPKDKIVAVGQEGQKPLSVVDMDLRDVVKMIRGKKGTKVTLTILRQAEKTKSFAVTIVRDKIDIKDQAAKITYETRKQEGKTFNIGIIDLPSFYGGGGKGTRSCSADVRTLLEEANKKKVDGIVLNLSRNGGGLLEEAVKVSGLFINLGGVVATKDSEAKVEVLSDEDRGVAYSGPLVLLTSRLSASASEILAGALHDYKRALIVGGDHTFGKGSVQALSGLPLDIGGVKVTTGMFFLPGGESTQHAGVPSDIQVPSVLNNEEIGENTLDYSLPPQKISGFLSKDANTPEGSAHWKEITASILKPLQQKSKERVDKDPKFTEIKKDIEDANKNKGKIKLADLRKKSETELKAEKKKGKDKMNSKDKIKDLDAPVVDEGVNILVDMIRMTSPQGAKLSSGV